MLFLNKICDIYIKLAFSSSMGTFCDKQWHVYWTLRTFWVVADQLVDELFWADRVPAPSLLTPGFLASVASAFTCPWLVAAGPHLLARLLFPCFPSPIATEDEMQCYCQKIRLQPKPGFQNLNSPISRAASVPVGRPDVHPLQSLDTAWRKLLPLRV